MHRVAVVVRSYVELLRPANVMTAVADILAGYAVTGFENPRALPWLVASTCCLYAGGVALNDFFDREIDAIERRERPVPSGRISPRGAALAGGALLAGGVLAAIPVTRHAGAIAALTALSVLLYDAWAKRHGVFGPINMGLCRALNLLLGMSAVPTTVTGHWYLALIPFVYIFGVTTLSRGEVYGGTHRSAAVALISLIIVLASVLMLAASAGRRSLPALALVFVFGKGVLPAFANAWKMPDAIRIRDAVRRGVLSLVLLDAVIGATYGGALYSVIILGVGVVAVSLARLFSVT
jgi:4-hydroxybenzoate polyprenyltransferase